MKCRIRLSESDLHRMIKESVKEVLFEDYENYTNKDFAENDWQHNSPFSYNYKDDRESLSKRDFSNINKGSFGGDYEMDDELMRDWDEMCNKLAKNYKDPSEVLDKLVHSNPLFKKWYNENHKKREIESSWRQFDKHRNDVQKLYQNEKDDMHHYGNEFSKNYPDYRYDAW